MNSLYKVVGISKQAVSQSFKRQTVFEDKLKLLLSEVDLLKKEHPGCGVEKMYYTLKPNFIGRDRFIELFMSLGYRLRKKKNYKRTTFSSSIYYPNIIKGMRIREPSIIWQTDITYIEVAGKFYYAIFIIDVYTKIIVGWQVSNHMRATANVEAFKMAIKEHKAPLIHHSDRGGQYIYKEYIILLEENGCKISMALTGQDNAYAERINRTIKEEYLDYWKPKTFKELKTSIKKAISHYNTKRPHNRIGKQNPEEFERSLLTLSKQERPVEIIYTEVENKTRVVSNHSGFKQELSLDHNCPIAE